MPNEAIVVPACSCPGRLAQRVEESGEGRNGGGLGAFEDGEGHPGGKIRPVRGLRPTVAAQARSKPLSLAHVVVL